MGSPDVPPFQPRQHYSADIESSLLAPYSHPNYGQLSLPSLIPAKTYSQPIHSPLTILAKLSAHVEALMSVGQQGDDLKRILVEGDLGLGLAMGMRGLVGKEAINPWRVMGVEIPVSPVVLALLRTLPSY
jgi:hypothetical protein